MLYILLSIIDGRVYENKHRFASLIGWIDWI